MCTSCGCASACHGPALVAGAVRADRSSVSIKSASTIVDPVTHTNPERNQSETGYVAASRDGSAIRRAVPGGLVREMDPLYKAAKYRGFIGVFAVSPAQVTALVPQEGYSGRLPMREQPSITRPAPWTVTHGLNSSLAGKT
jgi:hypothetical protein